MELRGKSFSPLLLLSLIMVSRRDILKDEDDLAVFAFTKVVTKKRIIVLLIITSLVVCSQDN